MTARRRCQNMHQRTGISWSTKNIEIAGSNIRAIGWIIKQLSAKFWQNSCCAMSRMWTSTVMEKHNTCSRHSTPLVLNDPLQFTQCFTITINVYCFTTCKEVSKQNIFPVPEHSPNHFPYQQRLFEFPPDRSSTMSPMHWLLLGFWDEVPNRSLIAMTILSRYSLLSLWCRCRNVSAAPKRWILCASVRFFGTHLVHNFLNSRCLMTISCNMYHNTCRKWLLSSVIVKRRFSIMLCYTNSTSSSLMRDGRPLSFSSWIFWWPSENCLYQRCTMMFGP